MLSKVYCEYFGVHKLMHIDEVVFLDCRDSLAPLAPFRLIMPYLFNLGSDKFRRWVVEHAPFHFVQHPRRIVDTITLETNKILETKKRAFEQGDKAVLEQVGEGRDILSTLRAYFNIPLVTS